VPEHVTDFILDLVRFTRPDEPGAPDFVKELVAWGAGPRACQNLVLAGKVRAVLRGRFHVTIDDVEALARPIMRHRIVTNFNAEADGVKSDDVVRLILEAVRHEGGSRALDAVTR
jgi:MoxR-like ATPase